MKPKISWVAPVYNKVAWIKDTIESIQAQTLKDIEIIFLDDGSTDGTADVIKWFAKKDKRIRLYRLRKNVGLGKAWNIATKLARSPIICVASGDDIWVRERSQITYDFFKEAIPFSKKKMLVQRKDGYCPQYIGHFTMALWTCVAKRVPYREDLKVGVDYPFICDLIKARASFGWTNKVLGYARLLPSGVSLSRREEVVRASK
jgi:glycosyltransferase involved in cell wall biosynthesis